MFKIGDVVVYGSSGICTVEGCVERNFGNELKDYYVLKPIYNDKTTIYAPKDTIGIQSIIRKIMSDTTSNEILEFFASDNVCEWNENDIERKASFKSALKNTDPYCLAKMLKSLYIHRSELKKIGKKLHSYDEDSMNNAEKLLSGEIAYALNSETSKITAILKKQYE